jgi:imidazolonepropionase-like amidohydrolase
VINSRYLLYEAQQAHHFSFPAHLALSSVTTVPAKAAGLGHRIGHLSEGVDADIVLWDSHPLQLGATPLGVWIDGVAQLPPARETKGKPEEWQEAPEAPNWDREVENAVEWEGLPPLEGKQESGKVIFRNVTEVWTKGEDGSIDEIFSTQSTSNENKIGMVVVQHGAIVCAGTEEKCSSDLTTTEKFKAVDLRGGTISPGMMSFGSPLGLEEIAGESSTGNGEQYDPFVKDIPSIMGDVGGVVRAVDALKYQTRDALFVMSPSSYLKGY